MDTPASSHDPLSSQTITERPERPIIHRTVTLRLNLRVMAAIGAGLMIVGAILPWIDPNAQALIGDPSFAPVVQGWPSLLIGLITLGVLALPHADASARWVSLPAAALGLAAAFIAILSALAASNAVAEAVARFSSAGSVPVRVTGAGIYVTLAGGILCVVAGLSHPPTASTEARLDLQPGQPTFAVFIASLVIIALVAGLIGAWIAAGRSALDNENPAAFPTDLLSTPVIDAQVTPLRATVESRAETPIPTRPPPELTSIPLSTVTPFSTPTLASPIPPSPGPSPAPTLTPSPTATSGSSPLATP